MDTDRLRSFCTIVETGSLIRASELLHVSHSALSKAMSVLQRELGVHLFQPRGRGLELTEAGDSVYLRTKEVLEQIEGLKQAAIRKTTQKAPLRIALSEALSWVLAGPLASRLDRPADFQQLGSGEVSSAILDSRVDFGLVFVPYPHPDLEFLPLKSSRMGVYLLAGTFAGRLAEQIPFVVPTSELEHNPLGIRARDGWPEGVSRQVTFGASNLGMALSLVEAGVAAAYIPTFLARALNRKRESGPLLREVHFSDKKVGASRQIFLVKKSCVPESLEMKALARLVRMHC